MAAKAIGKFRSFFFLLAQFSGGILGAMLANLMFKNPAIFLSNRIRSGFSLWLGEVVATAGLLFLIQVLRGQNRLNLAPLVLATWIGSAYFFTSSTSFANPAVTLGRGFSDTFSGIALQSVPLFIVAQIIGATLGTLGGRYFSNTKEKGAAHES